MANTSMQDPVCGNEVSQQTSRKEKYANKEFYFCSDDCLSRFHQNPGLYARSRQP